MGEIERLAIPSEIALLITRKSPPAIGALAELLAREAMMIDGIELRLQESKSPWYFQVRHRLFPHVVAYVNPLRSAIHIDYRLPQDHDTPLRVDRRSHVYGIAKYVQRSEDLPDALSLLRDAISREH
jgi:hypothetical protein